MKPRLQTSLGQQLVLTPQLRQALHLLQLSSLELENEIALAVESNPLLDWDESPAEAPEGMPDAPVAEAPTPAEEASERGESAADTEDAWEPPDSWSASGGGSGGGDEDGMDPMDRLSQTESLHDHLSLQLHLTRLSPRDQRIGAALIDAIDDDGYLREPLEHIAEALRPDLQVGPADILPVLHRIQRFDPLGVGARDLRECLRLQLDALSGDTPGRAEALRIVDQLLERLPRLGTEALAAELGVDGERAATGLQLVRSLDPRPGSQLGGTSADTYITPDCWIMPS